MFTKRKYFPKKKQNKIRKFQDNYEKKGETKEIT